MRTLLILFSSLLLTIIQAHAKKNASGNDENLSPLSQPESKITQRIDDGAFTNSNIHAAISYITARISFSDKAIGKTTGSLTGIEASFGVDLFSIYWSAEGALRAFGTQKDKNYEFNLKEFDLKIVYRDYIFRNTKIRTGFGIAARHLNVTDLKALSTLSELKEFSSMRKFKYKTLASLFFVGFENYITKTFSLGLELSYRSSLITETADQSSIEGSFKLGTHF